MVVRHIKPQSQGNHDKNHNWQKKRKEDTKTCLIEDYSLFHKLGK